MIRRLSRRPSPWRSRTSARQQQRRLSPQIPYRLRSRRQTRRSRHNEPWSSIGSRIALPCSRRRLRWKRRRKPSRKVRTRPPAKRRSPMRTISRHSSCASLRVRRHPHLRTGTRRFGRRIRSQIFPRCRASLRKARASTRQCRRRVLLRRLSLRGRLPPTALLPPMIELREPMSRALASRFRRMNHREPLFRRTSGVLQTSRPKEDHTPLEQRRLRSPPMLAFAPSRRSSFAARSRLR